MRKLFCILCVLLVVALLLPMTAASCTADGIAADGAPTEDIYAVMTLTDGSEITVVEAPDEQMMSAVDSYELYVEGEPVLSVEQQGEAPVLTEGTESPGEAAARSYYSVNFFFEGTDTEVFLTGLYGDQVEEIQACIITSYTTGESFDMTDLGFIDAEKLRPSGDGDDSLCWAASASDMLTYTGWAAQANAGFDTEDDVFEAYIDSFEDYGGNTINGFAWFFNGCAYGNNTHYYGAVNENYPSSGGYLKDYAFDTLCGDGSIADNGVSALDGMLQRLKEGCAVGLAVDIYYADTGESGGHAITLWGAVVDHSLSEDDPARYRSIFITDSDSDEINASDRRDSDNVMHCMPLIYGENGYYFKYSSVTYATLTEYYYLLPYSEALPTETDPAATKDKITTGDISVGEIYLTDTDGTYECTTAFETGTTVYFSYIAQNTGDAVYEPTIVIGAQITDADGTTVYSDLPLYGFSAGSARYCYAPFRSKAGLPAGDYTLTCVLNPEHQVSEAYYYNNTKSIDFKVRDSYLLGDYDGNGAVDILDATKIQRTLAGFVSAAADEQANERGNVNGAAVNIIDATQIQRYLASLYVRTPIGEKRLYR